MAPIKGLSLKLCFRLIKTVNRSMSSAIIYHEYGDPVQVLEMVSTDLPSELKPGQVKVRMLAAPVNPADLNMIQGTYALKPEMPAVAGNEGVGEVIQVGSGVKKLSPGNWVIPSMGGWGTWRTHAVCPQEELLKIDEKLSLESAATLSVNPCTAYRILRDYLKLSPGECVIQNGANSGVGRAVIQVAKQMGLVTINVVRNRDNLQELKDDLFDLGAGYVIVEEELRTPKMVELWSKMGAPRLALNCVGGKSATELLRHLAPKGSMITYGGMSKQPLTVPTGVLIFKEVKVLGYWMSRWSKKFRHTPEQSTMLNELTQMCLNGSLKPPKCKLIPFTKFKDAVTESNKSMVTHKQVLVMNY